MNKAIIITGPRNVGKTTFFQSWYEAEPIGFGFYSKKHLENQQLTGYDLILLPSQKCIQLNHRIIEDDNFSIRDECFEKQVQGVYQFNPEALSEAEAFFATQTDQSICWMDEIGPLEIRQRKGFYSLFLHQLNRSFFELHLVVQYGVMNEVCTLLHQYTSNVKVIYL